MFCLFLISTGTVFRDSLSVLVTLLNVAITEYQHHNVVVCLGRDKVELVGNKLFRKRSRNIRIMIQKVGIIKNIAFISSSKLVIKEDVDNIRSPDASMRDIKSTFLVLHRGHWNIRVYGK